MTGIAEIADRCPRPGGVRGRLVPLRRGPAAHRGRQLPCRSGPDRRHRRPDRRRQDDAGQPHHALLRPRFRRASRSTASTSRRCDATTSARRSAWCCRTPGCSREPSATTSPTAARTPPRRRSSRRPGPPTSTGSSHNLPDGYDTIIDDEGGNVSAGEKQLITIARAFLADPALLILDEATSSVDTRTEVLVQHAMAALRADRTSFVIAHRLSTIRDADLILVMEDGRIVEQGNHQELLDLGAAYATLYESQFSGPDVEEDPPAEAEMLHARRRPPHPRSLATAFVLGSELIRATAAK